MSDTLNNTKSVNRTMQLESQSPNKVKKYFLYLINFNREKHN